LVRTGDSPVLRSAGDLAGVFVFQLVILSAAKDPIHLGKT
jgi:hypothetical protein